MNLQDKDAKDRQAMTEVAIAIKTLNDALRGCIERKIGVEIGEVHDQASFSSTPPEKGTKVANDWKSLWTKEGLAVRFTREEIVAAPEPVQQPKVKDSRPSR